MSIDTIFTVIVTVAIALIGGLAFIVGAIVSLEKRLTTIEKDNQAQTEQFREHRDDNKRQHAELYDSRNDMRETMSELNAILKNLVSNQDKMDRKLDVILFRSGVGIDDGK